MTESTHEAAFAQFWATMCRVNGLQAAVEPVREFVFAPPRRWRFDFAWPDLKVAVEIDGGTWNGGRHASGVGMQGDLEKHNRATCLGWKVLRFTGQHLRKPDDVFEQLLTVMGALDEEED